MTESSPGTPAAAPDVVGSRASTPLPWATYLAIGAVWLATRALAVMSVDMTPWMLHDLEVYQRWLPLLHQAAFPLGDPTWQYPPGASVVFLGSQLPLIDYRWSFTIFVLLIDAAILLTLLIAQRRLPDARWRGPWLWSFAGVIVGSIMVTRFDLVPTLFAVIAVVLVGRPAWSGASAAVGFAIKVWPALMILALPRPATRRGVVAFVITAVGILAAFALLFDNSLSFLGNQRARGLEMESTGAVPYLLSSLFGGPVRFGLEYGSIQVFSTGTEIAGAVLTAVGLAIFAMIAWWRLRGRLDDVPAGDVALTVMLVSVATSRVYSPQFNTWLVGLAAAAMLARRSRLTTVTILVVITSVLTQFVYPWMATQLVTGGSVAIVIQSLRIGLLVTATALALRAIAGHPRQHGAG